MTCHSACSVNCSGSCTASPRNPAVTFGLQHPLARRAGCHPIIGEARLRIAAEKPRAVPRGRRARGMADGHQRVLR